MSFNGSGVFTIDTAGNPVVEDTDISPTVHNETMTEIAAGLSGCITKDGQTTITQNIPFNSKRITGLADGSSITDAVNVRNVIQNVGKYAATVGGTVDAITLTASPANNSLGAGDEYIFIAAGANTGAVTVNVNGLGVKNLTKNGTTALAASDIPAAGALVRITYDGTRFQLK